MDGEGCVWDFRSTPEPVSEVVFQKKGLSALTTHSIAPFTASYVSVFTASSFTHLYLYRPKLTGHLRSFHSGSPPRSPPLNLISTASTPLRYATNPSNSTSLECKILQSSPSIESRSTPLRVRRRSDHTPLGRTHLPSIPFVPPFYFSSYAKLDS